VGTGDTSRLKLPYLPTSADVVVGDLLVTSGLGGGFPAGYPVGTVAAVKRDAAQSLADVDVRPAAALDRSRELMLAWLRPSEVLPPAPSPATPTRAAPAGTAPAGTAPAGTAPASTAPASPGKPNGGQPAAAHAAAPAAKSAKAPAAKPPGGRTP